MNRILLLLSLLTVSLPGFSQSDLFIPRNIQAAYDAGTRSPDGKPGKNYWQNKADYTMDIHYNPHTLLLTGKESITYWNNSPDTLYELVFRLYPDLYKKGMTRDLDTYINPKDEGDGVTIERMLINRKPINVEDEGVAQRQATNLTVQLAKPILPHDGTVIDIHWHYTLNRGSSIRTGLIDTTAAFIAYCFPRVAVYDDTHGWDVHPYNGQQEFYNDFGQFDVNITVPKNYVVWATGQIQNAKDVLQKPVYDRYMMAYASDTFIRIIDSTDFSKQRVTADKKENTWQFTAMDVTDFAFAVSDHYLWDASSVMVDKNTRRRVLVNVAFNKDHKSYYRVPGIAKQCMRLMSDSFPGVPYPFPHISIIDGLDQMEYPMMVNDNPVEDEYEDIALTVHEMFHSYFPFYMGTNETQYAWMDEGWASVGEYVLTPMIDPQGRPDPYGVNDYAEMAGTERDAPGIISTTEFPGNSPGYLSPAFINAYPKPGLCYYFLREMLGRDTFNIALHDYMANWHGKHPMPYDFFNCINRASGKNLDWYWKPWFFEFGYPDLAIDSVSRDQESNNFIRIRKKGNIPVPIHLKIYYSDGSTKTIIRPASVWANNAVALNIHIHSLYIMEKLELGDEMIPDSKPEDNVYVRK